MSELEARFRVSVQGKEELTSFFSKGEAGAKSFASNVGKAFAETGKQIAGFALATGKSLASLALGDVGIASTAKKVLDFRDSLMDLAIQSGMSDDKLSSLTDQIHLVAKASNQMQGDVTEALGAFVSKTGDIDSARKNLELFGKVATATGASMKDVALVGVELKDKLKITDPQEMARAMGILTAQGRMGAVEIKDLATKAPKIFSAAASMFGVKGEEGLRGTGAMAQVFAKAFGGGATPANVATAMNTAFTNILTSQDAIEKAGINVKGRDPYEVIKDIVAKAGGDPRQLLKNAGHGIFDTRSLAGVNVLAEEYRRTGKFETFDRFKNANPNDLDSEVARRMSTGASKLKAVQIGVAASADKNLGDKFDWLAQRSGVLGTGFDFMTKNLTLTGGAAAGALVAWKTLTGALGGSGGGRGGGVGGLLGLTGGVQKVFVVNPGFGSNPGGGGIPGGGGAAGKVIPLVGALAAGYELGQHLDRNGALSRGFASSDKDIRQGMADAAVDRAFDKRTGGASGVRVKAQTPGQLLAQFNNLMNPPPVNIGGVVVNIAGDKATAEVDGTRSEEALVNRGVE